MRNTLFSLYWEICEKKGIVSTADKNNNYCAPAGDTTKGIKKKKIKQQTNFSLDEFSLPAGSGWRGDGENDKTSQKDDPTFWIICTRDNETRSRRK